jgi:hypothetical protein
MSLPCGRGAVLGLNEASTAATVPSMSAMVDSFFDEYARRYTRVITRRNERHLDPRCANAVLYVVVCPRTRL